MKNICNIFYVLRSLKSVEIFRNEVSGTSYFINKYGPTIILKQD